MHSFMIVSLDCEFFGVLFCFFHHHRHHWKIKTRKKKYQKHFDLIVCIEAGSYSQNIKSLLILWLLVDCLMLLFLFYSVLSFWAVVVAIAIAIEFLYIWKKVCWRCHRNMYYCACTGARARPIACVVLLLLLFWVIFQLKKMYTLYLSIHSQITQSM